MAIINVHKLEDFDHQEPRPIEDMVYEILDEYDDVGYTHARTCGYSEMGENESGEWENTVHSYIELLGPVPDHVHKKELFHGGMLSRIIGEYYTDELMDLKPDVPPDQDLVDLGLVNPVTGQPTIMGQYIIAYQNS